MFNTNSIEKFEISYLPKPEGNGSYTPKEWGRVSSEIKGF